MTMYEIPIKTNGLPIARCPHCRIAKPNLSRVVASTNTTNGYGGDQRTWGFFACQSCGGVVMGAWSNPQFVQIWPDPIGFSEDIPAEPLDYLTQAFETLNAPRASVVTSAGAVDSMLKARGLDKGSLYSRIDQAVANALLTKEMGDWAHDVRLDANDQRHADLAAVPPTIEDAKRCLEFAKALADILFVLPARVTRGKEQAEQTIQELKSKKD